MALLALQALSQQMTVFGAFVGHYMSQAASPVEAEVVSCQARNVFLPVWGLIRPATATQARTGVSMNTTGDCVAACPLIPNIPGVHHTSCACRPMPPTPRTGGCRHRCTAVAASTLTL